MNKVIKVLSYFQYNSQVILSYFFICLIVLMFSYITKEKSDRFFSSGRSSLLNPLTYIGFITHIFGHSEWDHLAHNFILILLIGPMIEEKYGSILLLKMILICAVVIGVLNFIFSKKWIYGSSGILYMLIVLSSFVNIDGGKIPLTLVFICLFYVIGEVKSLIQRKKDNVSHLGHLIGAVCGLVFGLIIHYNIDFFNYIHR